jgi:glucuronokinase
MEMIQTARRCGASAKFAGSGGSLVGIYRDEDMFERLNQELGKLGAKVIRPQVV